MGATPSLLDLDPKYGDLKTDRRLPPDLRHRPRGLARPARQVGSGRGFRKATTLLAPGDVIAFPAGPPNTFQCYSLPFDHEARGDRMVCGGDWPAFSEHCHLVASG